MRKGNFVWKDKEDHSKGFEFKDDEKGRYILIGDSEKDPNFGLGKISSKDPLYAMGIDPVAPNPNLKEWVEVCDTMIELGQSLVKAVKAKKESDERIKNVMLRQLNEAKAKSKLNTIKYRR